MTAADAVASEIAELLDPGAVHRVGRRRCYL